MGTPFGGAKASGYGREHAIETMREFTRTKNVRTVSGRGPVPAWSAASELLPTAEERDAAAGSKRDERLA
jgi:hypothetical protein